MTTQNIFYADPRDAAITGFIFTDLDTYHGEYGHRRSLFGTKDYELKIVRGNQIDLELFAGLKINQCNLTTWFDEIQHLTFDEKVGLWFLVHESGFSLTQALVILQDGLAIFHGSKNGLATMSQQPFVPNMESLFQEFRFAGETWCGNSMAY